ncbi:unnamed protein product, partial [Allacma fusca]
FREEMDNDYSCTSFHCELVYHCFCSKRRSYTCGTIHFRALWGFLLPHLSCLRE